MLPYAPVRPRRLPPVPIAAAALFALVLAGCDGVPLTAPAGTAITLLASTTTLPANGTAEITAVLIEGAFQPGGEDGPGSTINGVGTPVHDGTLVIFSTSLGRIEPAEVRTEGGRARATLIGDGRSGVATITAFSGGAISEPTLEITIGGASVAGVIMTATPQSLPPGGGQAVIQARVVDEAGNGVAGIPVSFSTTRGSLSASSVTTDQAGTATTTLTATATATVTASAGSADTQTGSIEVTLAERVSISIMTPAVIAVSTPATFTIGVAAGGGSASAVVTDAVINFGDGTDAPLGTLIGTGHSVVHLYAAPGIETVTVSGRDPEGNPVSRSTQVAVGPLTATVAATTSSPGNRAVFTVTVTPTTALIDRYIWDFGDGTGLTTSSPTIDHVYGTSGTKSVKVTVVPVAGAPIEVFTQVNVS